MEKTKFSQVFTIINFIILFILLCFFIYLSIYFSQRVDETKQIDIGKIKHLNTLMWICIFFCVIITGMLIYAGINYYISSQHVNIHEYTVKTITPPQQTLTENMETSYKGPAPALLPESKGLKIVSESPPTPYGFNDDFNNTRRVSWEN
jgi:hypothetical protein